MARDSSAVYRAQYNGGPIVEDLRVSDEVMRRAKNGEQNYQKKVAMAFRKRVEKDTGHNPGWIDYHRLALVELRDVPAPASKPRARRPSRRSDKQLSVEIPPQGVTAKSMQLSPEATRVMKSLKPSTESLHDDVAEGGCGCECDGCEGCNFNFGHCGRRERGCKH